MSVTPPVGPVRRDAATAAFFDGTARGEFLIRRCDDCGALGEPTLRGCARCGSPALGWVPAAGGARVVSWAVTHARPGPDGVAGPPTVLVVAALDEGPWWWSRLVDADPAAVTAGAPLRIAFERAPGADEPDAGYEAVPVFRLAPGGRRDG